MHGFINSPALAKLVALQMVDDQIQQSQRKQSRTSLTSFRIRFFSRSTGPRTAVSVARVAPTARLVQDV